MNRYVQIAFAVIFALNIVYFCKTASEASIHAAIVSHPTSSAAAIFDINKNVLKSKIESEQKDSIVEELRKKLTSEKSAGILKDIENDLYRKNRDSILEELKLKFYKENKEEILKSLRDDYISDNNPMSQKLHQDAQKPHADFFNSVLKDIMVKHKPKSAPLTAEEEGGSCGCMWHYDMQTPAWSIEWLKKGKVSLPKEKFNDLQSNHDAVVKDLAKLEYPSDVFKGKGIVINGGGIYFGSALIVVRQLRELGSKLPIELVLNDDSEFDKNICENVLPKLNGKCTIISKVIGKELHDSLKLQKFQLKAMGIFVSSFEEMILLDADNFPIKNVDELFNTPMYKDTQFLMWPDVWQKGASPLYYDIARIELGEPIRRHQIGNDKPMLSRAQSPLHDLEGAPPAITIETGQMVVSKKTHLRSILLALYYNMYGGTHYYRLLYQGTCGDGDKETFIAALHVLKEPYYLNEYPGWLAGYFNPDFTESTIVQHDIMESYNYHEGLKKWLKKNNMDSRFNLAQRNDYTHNILRKYEEETGSKMPSVQFLHLHDPKPNPIKNFDDKIYDMRHLGKPHSHSTHWTHDWELKVYSISKWIACKVLDKTYYEKLHKNGDEVCKKVSEFVEFLKKDSHEESFAQLSDIGF